MRFQRSGAATAAYAVVAIVVIAVGAAAYFFVVAPSMSGTTTSSTHSSSTLSIVPSSTYSTVTAPSPQSSSAQSSTLQVASSTPTSTTTSQTSSSPASSTSYTTYSTASTTTYSTAYTTTYTSTFSTATCTATSSTATGPTEAQLLNFSQTFADYSEMAVHFNGTENGMSYDATYDYHVVLVTPASYKVNVSLAENGVSAQITDYVLKNGTAAAVYFFGQNYTGSQAAQYYFTSMAPYYLGNVFASAEVFGQLTNSSLIHVAGTNTVMLGPTIVYVTDYAPNSLPISEDQCGSSIYFSKLSLEVGNITGESLPVLTGMEIAGTVSGGGTSETLNISYHVTSVTKSA